MNHKILIIANIDERTNLQVAQIEGEKMLNFREMAHIMVDSISLLIKLSNENNEMKDYELMEEVIQHMNYNFISTKAFNDAEILVGSLKKSDE